MTAQSKAGEYSGTDKNLRLKELRLQNYRNINTEVKFDNPCFLIGPNGSGKSNLFESIKFVRNAFLGSSTEGSIRRAAKEFGGIGSIFSYQNSGDRILWSATLGNLEILKQFSLGISNKIQPYEFIYEFQIYVDMGRIYTNLKHEKIFAVRPNFAELLKNNKGFKKIIDRDIDDHISLSNLGIKRGDENFVISKIWRDFEIPLAGALFNYFISCSFYNGNNFSLQNIRNHPSQIDSDRKILSEDGANLANVFFHIYNTPEGHAAQKEIEEFIREHVDQHFSFMKTQPIDYKFISLAYKRDNADRTFNLDTLSDGLVRMLLWIAVLLHPSPPPLIVIDEPELGLHPQWMGPIMNLIWKAATRTQVIVATHSPELLDQLEPEEAGHVIVCEQDENGFARFNTLDPEPLKEWLREYRLGELYRLGRPEIGGWE